MSRTNLSLSVLIPIVLPFLALTAVDTSILSSDDSHVTNRVLLPALGFSVSVMDDGFTPLEGATVTVTQLGDSALTTDIYGLAQFPDGAIKRGDVEVLIEHPSTLPQRIGFRIPFRFDHYNLTYAVPLWRAGSLSTLGDTTRSSNELDVFEAIPSPVFDSFDFDYANLRSRSTVQAFVTGTIPDDVHAALVMKTGYTTPIDWLTIHVDTEDLYGAGVPASVQVVDVDGNPVPSLTIQSISPPFEGYPTSFTVEGTFPLDEPVLFLLGGEPIARGTRGDVEELLFPEPCASLPSDPTNPDPEICQLFLTLLPKAQLLGCVANCGGSGSRKGKFGGKVTGQVGVKLGFEATYGGGTAGIDISASGEVSGWFEEEYDIEPGTQRCWYLCSRETVWRCCDWLCRWFDIHPRIDSVYAVGTDVVDSDC